MAKGGGGSGPTVAKAYVAIIPTTKDAQKNISKALIPELDSAGKEGGKALSGGIGSALSSGISKVASAAKIAAGAGVAALGALTAAATSAFSDWEQLSGGVETIFGEESAKAVIRNAKNAFGTVQMSANDYLDTVTSFSASLIQSLGGDTDAAASMADMAIADMADNANKMGSSISSIQNAYQGFAKQNYSMLDNLKLGYGGTQQEMYRLMQDAASLNEEFAQTADFEIDENGHLTASFADITRAIHIVQDSMGIAGASAQEAASTLEGSFNMMSASWTNLITSFGTGKAGWIEGALQDFIDSTVTWLSNLVPRVGLILRGIIREIPYIFTIIAERLPEWSQAISAAIPDVVSEITRILAQTFGIKLDDIMSNRLVQSIIGLSTKVQAAFNRVFGNVDFGSLLASFGDGLARVGDIIGTVMSVAGDAIATLIDSIDPAFLESLFANLQILGQALVGIFSTIQSIIADVVVGLLVPTLSDIWTMLTENILPGMQGIFEAMQPGFALALDMLGQVYNWISQLVGALVDFLQPTISAIFAFIGPLIGGLLEGIQSILSAVISVVTEIWEGHIRPFVDALVERFGGFFSTIGKWISDHQAEINFVLSVIGASVGALVKWIGDTIGAMVSAIGSIIGGIVDIVTNIFDVIYGVLTGDIDLVKSALDGLVSSIGDIFWGVVDLILAPFRSAFNSIRRLWNSTVGSLSFSVPDWVPGIGGKSFGMPKLASGGILTRGGTVMVGEAGPEILSLPSGARVAPLDAASATSGETTYSVVVGDVDITDDDQVRRVTREYLEFLASIARPGAVAI